MSDKNPSVFHRLIRGVKKLFGMKESPASLRKTFEKLLKQREISDEKTLSDTERFLISHVLSMGQETVEDIMIPRVDIVSLAEDATTDEIEKALADQTHSRLLVYGKSLDDLIGYVAVKDLFLHLRKADLHDPKKDKMSLRTLCKEPLYVPQSTPILSMLTMMRETHVPIAVVVDEFGGIDGLVTPWDIMKEIFDHMDHPEFLHQESTLRSLGENVFEADARLPLETFLKTFGLTLTAEQEEAEIDTLGGYVVSLAGRVPSRMEMITGRDGLEFTILEASPRHVSRLLITQTKKKKNDNTTNE